MNAAKYPTMEGYELIQGKGNQVCFDTSCPKCDNLIKAEAWIEFNSLLEHKQCSLCGYDKVNATRLADESLSGIDANIEIQKNLFELAEKGDVAALIWFGKHALNMSDD
jgi:Zn ribbon nucleic-acid-binding protein